MSSDITLSSAVRNNLLALQNTASMMATAQNQLATGKKVNSALDNPTNFFTASSLDSRANDLTSLLDGVSNGVQTLQAADTGITGITSLVNQLQATARQALQSSAAYSSKASISTGAITGMSATDLLAGATKSTSANATLAAGTAISAPAPAGHASAAAGTAVTAPVAASAPADVTGGAVSGSLGTTQALTINGVALTVDTTAADAAGNNDGTLDADDAASAINTAIQAALTADPTANAALTNVSVTSDGTNLTISNTATGSAAGISVGGTDAATFGLGSVVGTTGQDASGGLDASGGTITFKVNGTQVSLLANGGTNGDGHYSAQDIADAINGTAGIKANATATGGMLSIASTNTAGTGDSLTIDTFSAGSSATDLGFATATVNATNGTAASGGIDATVAGGVSFEVNGKTVNLSATGGTNNDGHYSAADLVSAINTQVGTSAAVSASQTGGVLTLTSTATAGESDAVTLGGFTGTTATALGFSSTSASGSDTYSGGPANGLAGKALTLTGTDGVTSKTITFGSGANDVHTLDQLNTALSSLNLQASVGNDGTLSITTNNSAGAESFSVTGGTATGAGNSFASTDVSAVTLNGDGEEARNNFVTQYNSLLSQIDSLAQDSSYNGVNLLNSDDLTITMNETGSSKLDIKGVNDSSTGLNLTALSNTNFADSDSINKVLDTLNTAVSTLRSQSSQFGSNLSVVQTRQDFTNSLVNVLQTGSSNLTTADTNQVSANLLALQTRQSLSTTALSMASQADQSVLQLFQ